MQTKSENKKSRDIFIIIFKVFLCAFLLCAFTRILVFAFFEIIGNLKITEEIRIPALGIFYADIPVMLSAVTAFCGYTVLHILKIRTKHLKYFKLYFSFTVFFLTVFSLILTVSFTKLNDIPVYLFLKVLTEIV